MKLKNGEIFNAKEPLKTLMGEKFPVKISYGLAKLAAKLDGQLKIIEGVREGLIRTYGEPQPDNPQMVRVTDANLPKFSEELGELMMQEVDLDIEVVTLPDTLEVEPATLMALDNFIKI